MRDYRVWNTSDKSNFFQFVSLRHLITFDIMFKLILENIFKRVYL